MAEIYRKKTKRNYMYIVKYHKYTTSFEVSSIKIETTTFHSMYTLPRSCCIKNTNGILEDMTKFISNYVNEARKAKSNHYTDYN